MDAQRALMDQLMGAERDVKLEERTNRTRHFSDDDVCKHYLCGLSPFFLFKNTKSDFRHQFEHYDKICDDGCQLEWERLPQAEKDTYGYEYDLMKLLEELVQDLDRKVSRGKMRVKNDERAAEMRSGGTTDELEEERKVMLAKIEELNTEAEDAGEEGDVEKATALMEQAKVMKAAADELEKQAQPLQEKKLIICEVSGNFMSSTDNEERLQAHYAGKQYKGTPNALTGGYANPGSQWVARNGRLEGDQGQAGRTASQKPAAEGWRAAPLCPTACCWQWQPAGRPGPGPARG
jgi:hypothetical protein